MSRHNKLRRVRNTLQRQATSASGSPSFTRESPLDLREVAPGQWHLRWFINASNSYLRMYEIGDCSVIVTREDDKWHLSIAHPSRDPLWREIAEARYRVVPGDVTMAMLLPPMDEYINIHSHCFQLVEID